MGILDHARTWQVETTVFAADARFFRSAMNRVIRQLRALDPSLDLLKL